MKLSLFAVGNTLQNITEAAIAEDLTIAEAGFLKLQKVRLEGWEELLVLYATKPVDEYITE